MYDVCIQFVPGIYGAKIILKLNENNCILLLMSMEDIKLPANRKGGPGPVGKLRRHADINHRLLERRAMVPAKDIYISIYLSPIYHKVDESRVQLMSSLAPTNSSTYLSLRVSICHEIP